MKHISRAAYSFSIAFTMLLCLNTVTAQEVWKKQLLQYINTRLARPDGGFGWEDQYDSHIAPTFAAVSTLHNINALPKDKQKLIQYVRTHHPQRTSNKETGG